MNGDDSNGSTSNNNHGFAHSRNASNHSIGQDSEGSVFSHQNPLPADFRPNIFGCHRHDNYPQRPKAVVKTGWSRTVLVDEELAPSPPNVTLGAPGTGLSKSALATEKALGPTVGRKARHRRASSADPFPEIGSKSWGSARVTADDLAAAASLRKVKPPEGAVPLPSPIPWSEADASSMADSSESPSRWRPEHGSPSPSHTVSSSVSSDLNFLVSSTAGSFFGTRPTVGRSVEKRIPATVGEATLHDSLAKYFGNQPPGRETSECAPHGGSAGKFLHTASTPSLSQPLGEHCQVASSFINGNFTPATKSTAENSSFEDNNDGSSRVLNVAVSRQETKRDKERGDNRRRTNGTGADRDGVDGGDARDGEKLEMKFYPSMQAAATAAEVAASRHLKARNENIVVVEENGKRDLLGVQNRKTLRGDGGGRWGRRRRSPDDSISSSSSNSDYVESGEGIRSASCVPKWPWKVR